MESWPALPESSLAGLGSHSKALLDAGCTTYREAARFVHELPYGRNSDRSDYRRVLIEGLGTCSTKHALLAAVAREEGLIVDLTLGIYEMTEANTPGVGGVLSAHGLSSIPEAHCYLRYRGQRIDITRSGESPLETIATIQQETSISPDQIGEYKLDFHKRFLKSWLAEHPHLHFTPEELWSIREECILALSAA